MTQPAQHPACPECAQTAALAAEMRERLDAITYIVLKGYEDAGMTPPAVLTRSRPVKRTASGRPSLTCLPGGSA